MTKIYEGIIQQYPTMKIQLVDSAELLSEWQQNTLSGYCWRLYHNDSDGAGIYSGGKKIEMLPDKIYLLVPNCELKTWVEKNPRQLYIHFDMDRLTGRSDILYHELPMTDSIKEKFESLQNMLDTQVPQWRITLKAFQLAAEVLEQVDPALLCESEQDERITRVRNHISNSPGEDFTLESMAQEAGMSVNAFLTRFQEIMKVTPYQYLLRVRYTTAAYLLKNGKHDIEEVCEMVGVKDRFHFSRRFKELFGIPPGAYRKS